jgi:hypothetical protein
MIMARNGAQGLYMTVSGHDDGSPAVAAQTPPKLGRRPRLPVVTRRRRGECLPPGLAEPPVCSTTRAWPAQQQTGPPLGSVNPSYIMLSVQ